jgi:hypothetical protein
MKAYEGVETQFHSFRTSAPNKGHRSASRPDRFILRESASGTPLIHDWVGPRATVESIHQSSSQQPGHYTDANLTQSTTKHILHSVHYNSIITIQTIKCTEFY